MRPTGSELLHTMLLATSALVASTLIASTAAMAGGPTGGKVAVGSATITTPSSTQTVVDQTSQKALINWNSFSVPTGSSITFEQPNASSLTVNRVLGPDASTIDGQLLANGNIWLINANGILFGHGSQVNVGALLATTSDLSDDDFTNGRYRFTKAGKPGASVVNQGAITAGQGGSVVLSGSQVSNQGVIQANLGTVVLGGASEFTVDLNGDNLLRYQIVAPVTSASNGNAGSGSALVSNSGTIAAAGGRILLTARAAQNVQDDVINNTGQIEATSVSSHDGEIDFDAGPDGTVNAGGTIDASGQSAGQTGGAINVAGGTVNVTNGATINASGDAGGGTIQIGGGLHGKGTIANSNATNIGSATISANAIVNGNGGTVAIWSNGTTNFAGTVSATGGAQGGNGGLVETSGGNVQVGAAGKVITSAAKGTTGDWLLDPTNIDIETDGTDGIGGSDISPTTIINALGSTNVTLEATNDITISNAVDYSSSNTLSLLASQDIIANASVQNSGSGAINLIAGWDGVTTNLSQLTNPGVYGNNNGTITIGGENANGDVAIGSAGGTTTFAAANLTVVSDSGYAQAGYHGAGGGDIDVDLTGNLTINGYGGDGSYAMVGNGSLNGDVSGSITGNISINAAGATVINVGEGGGSAWIGNFAGEGSIESGNVQLITGYMQGDTGQTTLGDMLVADLGTTSSAGSGGNVTFGLTNAQTDFINTYLGAEPIEYNSPNALTLLSTDNLTLPYSIQNDGTGNLTILAGWNASVAPANVLTTPNAFGQNNEFVWIVGDTGTLDDYNPNSEGGTYVNSGAGVAIGSMGGTTTIGAAQIYIEGLSGYAQIGYHNSGGTGAIDVVANGVPGTGQLTGISACFDGDANICVIGGRENANNADNVTTYAQIGDLGFGVTGTSSADINVSATGNIAVAGGGIYNNSPDGGSDPEVPNAYGMIGNGDGAQTVAQTVGGAITVNVTGQMNFASSAGTGSDAWLGNRTGTGGLSSGNLTLIAGSESDTGPVDFSAMVEYALGTTSVAGSGGDVTIGETEGSIDLKNDNGFFYNSPNSLTLLSADNVDVESSLINSGTGNITLVAGWNPSVAPANIFTTSGSYGLNNGIVDVGDSSANGNVAVGSMTGTTTVAGAEVDVAGLHGYAQIGFPGNGGSGTINVYATSSAAPVYNQDSAPCLTGSGNVCIASGSSSGFYAQIGNGGYGMSGTSSGNINVAATGNVVLIGGGTSVSDGILVAGNTVGSYAMIGNGDGSQINAATIGGDISITAGGETYLDSGSDPSSPAWLGNLTAGEGSEHGALTLITGTENDQGSTSFRQMIESDLGAGDGTGGDVIVGFTDPDNTLNIDNNVSYASSNSLTILSMSNIVFENSFQNSGTGDITVVAGWNGTTLGTASQLESANAYGLNGATVTVGGTGASGDAAVGTAGGTMSVLTDNLDVESDNGIAQIGYSGAGTGNINVAALGNVTVDALNGPYAQIGNGGGNVSGNVGGAISVSSGGTILVESDAQQSDAAIGNIGGATSSESGGITIGATALDINAVGAGANAFVGNGSILASTGGATGDIGITSGDVSVVASGDGTDAAIGDGIRFSSAGTTGGNIDVNAATIEIVANETDSETSEARIANRGSGTVEGSYDIVTTGNIELSALDGNLAAIGNGVGGTGTSTGNLTVQSGGSISLASIDGGETRIGDGAAADSTIAVTAAGDITLSVTGNPGEYGSGTVLIGNLGGAVGGNVSVASTGGSIDLNASEDGSAIQIGNIQNGVTANVSGNIQVSAQDNVTLDVTGANTDVQIGNGGAGTQGNDAGNVVITATTGNIVADLEGTGAFVQIGNGGNGSTGSATGDTSLTAGNGLQLTVGSAAADSGSYIQVGDGATFGATSGGGNIVVSSSAMSTTNSVDFVGNSLDIALTGANQSVGANNELWVVANNLAITTDNGSAFVYSPQGISLGVGEDGINLGTGELVLATAGPVTQTQSIDAAGLGVYTSSGAITLTNGQNAVSNLSLGTSGSDSATFYDVSALTITGAQVGGDLTVLTTGNLTFTGSATGGGAILAVAGWDGTTTSPSALTTGTAYGNNGGSIVIGGAGQNGNVDIGSATGSITLAADNVSLTATNGYAQVGYNGAGSGTIDVVASGNVTLTAGTQNDEFALIGNGGWNVSGNESGNITVDASGNVVLDGGSGQETFAQIGHGGTGTNSFSEGYSDTGLITVDGESVTLAAGSSQGSYAQIGSGGYQSGQDISGTATLGGDINVNAVSAVSLTGNGPDAYAQIGNGGDYVNTGAANGASGTISGDIVVSVTDASNHTSPDPVTVKAGSGADSYAQIGNGGNGENTPADGATVNFAISGNVTVSDLTLIGSDTGANGYAQVGNGDASKQGTGDISGDITIGPGIDVTIDNGTAPGTDSMIGNDTGFGTITGTITGYTASSGNPVTTPGGNGDVATTTQTQITPTDTDVNVVTVVPEDNGPNPPDNTPAPINQPPGPLDQLADIGGGNTEGTDTSDDLTTSLGRSLDPGSHNAPITVVKSIIPGVLTEVVMKDAHGPHGVPPADEDYSSWGNEALWQW
jgi:filamentous hemagglutinin family protein